MPSPHVHYAQGRCPHGGCVRLLEWIDFRVEVYEAEIEQPLLRAWWAGTGFAGRCPECRRWIHFDPKQMRLLSDEDAAAFLQLPDDWHLEAQFVLDAPPS